MRELLRSCRLFSLSGNRFSGWKMEGFAIAIKPGRLPAEPCSSLFPSVPRIRLAGSVASGSSIGATPKFWLARRGSVWVAACPRIQTKTYQCPSGESREGLSAAMPSPSGRGLSTMRRLPDREGGYVPLRGTAGIARLVGPINCCALLAAGPCERGNRGTGRSRF
jgi:hypothetical protein